MVGRATLTIDASRTTMNCATQSRINAVHRRSRYCCAVVTSRAPFLRSLPLDEREWADRQVLALSFRRNLTSAFGWSIRNSDSGCMTTVTQQRTAAGEREARSLRADARRNREAVIAAAKKLFAAHGLEAQMPDVAKAANVGVGTVYRHFPTKDDLIAAMAAERFERLAEKAREALEIDDAWEGVADFIRFYAQIQADDRGLCEVMGSSAWIWAEKRMKSATP